MASPSPRGAGAARRRRAGWRRLGRRVCRVVPRRQWSRRPQGRAARPPPFPVARRRKRRARLAGGAASPAPRRARAAGGSQRRQGAAPRRRPRIARPQATGAPRRAAPRRPTAAATRPRCLGAAGRRRATAGRRWPWPAARWWAAPAARQRREAPRQHVPLVWLVACQSFIGTKLDQQICIRRKVLKHIHKIIGKCVSQILPEAGQTG